MASVSHTHRNISSFEPPGQIAMKRMAAVLKHFQHVNHESQLTADMIEAIDKLIDCRKDQREEEFRVMQAAISNIQKRMQIDAPLAPSEWERYASSESDTHLGLEQDSSSGELSREDQPTKSRVRNASTQTPSETPEVANELSGHADKSMEEFESPAVLHSSLAEESAIVTAAWAEHLPPLAADVTGKSAKELKQTSILDCFTKLSFYVVKETLEDAPVRAVSTSTLNSVLVPFSKATQTLFLPSDMRSLSDSASSFSSSSSSSFSSPSSSPQARATTPDTEVPSVSSSPVRGATNIKSPTARDITNLSGDPKAPTHENKVVVDSSNCRPGGLSSDKEKAETVRNLQSQRSGECSRSLKTSRFEPAAVNDVAEGSEGLPVPPEDEATNGKSKDDREILLGDGDPATRDDDPHELTQAAAPSSGVTASVVTPARNTDSTSTGLTSEMEDVTATFAVASLIPHQAAMVTPAAPTVASPGSAQMQCSPPTPDVDMAGACDAESSTQTNQPSVQHPLPPTQVALPSPASTQVPTAEDVDMACSVDVGLPPASSPPEMSSTSRMDCVAADDSGPLCPSSIPPDTHGVEDAMDLVGAEDSVPPRPSSISPHTQQAQEMMSAQLPLPTPASIVLQRARAPGSTPSFMDFSEGIWHELYLIGPSLLTNLRNAEGRLKDEILEVVPNLHPNVVHSLSHADTAVNLLRSLKRQKLKGQVSEPQLRSLMTLSVQAQSENATMTDHDTHNTSSRDLFRDLRLPSLQSSIHRAAAEPTNPVWDELRDFGTSFHADMARTSVKDMIQEVLPNLHPRVSEEIFRFGSSNALLQSLRHRNNSGQLSIQEVCLIKDCVAHYRSENGNTSQDNGNTPQDNGNTPQNNGMQDTISAPGFFSDASLQQCLQELPSAQPLPDEFAPHANKLCTLLYNSRQSMQSSRTPKRFASMYKLPWDDATKMQAIVHYVVRVKSSQLKNVMALAAFVQKMDSATAPDLIWYCLSSALALNCEIKPSTHRVKINLRMKHAAQLFQAIAHGNALLIADKNENGCLNWDGMLELAAREERIYVSSGETDHYFKGRLQHWKDINNARIYVNTKKGDTRITCGTWFLPTTITKRRIEDIDANTASGSQDGGDGVASRPVLPMKRIKLSFRIDT